VLLEEGLERVEGSHTWLVALDDPVGPQQQRLRDRQADGFRGLEFVHQLKLRGLLDRRSAGLG
jgi:hypothetical protein